MRRFALITSFGLSCAAIYPFRQVDNIPPDAQRLIKCYPEAIADFSNNYLIFKDHSKMLWDDGIKNKSWQTLLDNPDLKDMFSQKYETDQLKELPVKNFDPGRIRDEKFLRRYTAAPRPKLKRTW